MFTINPPEDMLSQNLLKFSRVCVFVLVFFLPLFFFPTSLDVLEVNKQTLLVLGTFVAVLAWIGSMLLKKTITFQRGWMNIFPVLLLVSVLVSAMLSDARYLSFIGAATQEYMSVLSMLAFCAFFFLVANTMRSRESQRTLFALFLLSSTIVGIIGAASLLGLPLLPFSFASSEVFNTIGTLNSLGFFLAIASVLASGLWVADQGEHSLFLSGAMKRTEQICTVLLVLLTLFVLIALDFWALWLILLAGLAVLFSFLILRASAFPRISRVMLPGILAAIALLFLLWLPSVIQTKAPVEVTLNDAISMDIASSVLQDESALFGSGPGTFMFSYAQYHGPEVNETPFWNVRFDRASSYAWTVVTSLGVIGACFWLLFLVAVAGRSFQQVLQAKRGLEWLPTAILLSAWMGMTLGAFLYSFNLTLLFTLFLFAGLLGAQGNTKVFQRSLSMSTRLRFVVSSGIVAVAVFIVFLIFVTSQRYLAEAAFAKAVRLDRAGADAEDVLDGLDRAATLVKYNDIYYRNLAQALLIRLGQEVNTIDPGNPLTQERSAYIQALTAASINASVRATSLSPKNVQNWQVRAGVYRELIGIATDADRFAIAAYTRAVELEPANPINYTNLGEVHLLISENARAQTESDDPATRETAEAMVEEHLDNAEDAFESALALKPDHAPAHYQLGIVYERRGALDQAVGKLESVAEHNPLDVGVAFQLGMLYLRRGADGDLDRARVQLERAVNLVPSYSNARWFLASIYEQQGRFDEAIAQVEKVLEVNPGDDIIRKRLDALQQGKAQAELPPPLEEESLAEPSEALRAE